MASPVVNRSFVGGEIDPALAARADLARYNTSARTMRNFIARRSGGAQNRPGTRLLAELAANDSNCRLIPYIHEDPLQSVLIEAGEGYLRFYGPDGLISIDPMDVEAYDSMEEYTVGTVVSDGGDLFYAIQPGDGHATSDGDFWHELVGGVLEIPTPFSDPGLFNWHQSGRVITFTHRNVAPHELIFQDFGSWIFQQVSTAPVVDPPQNPALAASVGTRYLGYVVTAAAPETFEESRPSAQVIDAAAAPATPDDPRVITWDAQDVNGVPCEEYYVYKDDRGNGTFGYIGTSTGAEEFKDTGIEPDYNVTPPIPRVLFDAEGLYPHVSATHQQRRIFANTDEFPDAIEASRLGFRSNFEISSPLQDDDAIKFRVAGNNHHAVQHLLSLKAGLVMMTGGGEWIVTGPEGRAITPNGIEANQDTYIGAAEFVKPVVHGNGIIYVQGRASQINEIKFGQQLEGLAGRDLTVFAAHLFDGHTIVDMAIAYAPTPIIWAVRSDGVLLGLTYIPEQDVWGWHRHDTEGDFERVCVLPGEGYDRVFFVVHRTINGSSKRFIEEMAARTILDFNRDSFFVDCGLSYAGAATSAVSGLEHLEGETVAVLADGIDQGLHVVAGGGVSLAVAAEDIHVGLPIVFDLETVSLDVAGSGVRDKKKKINSISLLLQDSARAFQAGPNEDRLKDFERASYDSTARSFSGKVELTAEANFDFEGRVFVRQEAPLPVTILAVIPNFDIGD